MNEIRQFFQNKKNIANLLILLVIVLGLPIGIGLVRNQQILFSRAASNPITFISNSANTPDATDAVVTRNGQQVVIQQSTSTVAVIQLSSPIGPAKTAMVPTQNTQASLIDKVIPPANAEVSCTPQQASTGDPPQQCQGSNGQTCYQHYVYSRFVADPSGPVVGGDGSQGYMFCNFGPCNESCSGGNAPPPQQTLPPQQQQTQAPAQQQQQQQQQTTTTPAGGRFSVSASPSNVSSVGGTLTIDATGNAGCSQNVNMDDSGGGFGTKSCSANLVNSDPNNFDWRFTCTTTAAGSFTARLSSAGGTCQSSAGYSVGGGNASSSPSPTAPPITTTSFQISDNRTKLDSAAVQNYTSDGMITNLTLTPVAVTSLPATITVFVKFTGSNGQSTISQQSILLVPPDPVLAACDPQVDITGAGINFNITGTNFGNKTGNILANGQNLRVTSWTDSAITAVLDNLPSGTSKNIFSMTLKRNDGTELDNQQCGAGVGISQIQIKTAPACATLATLASNGGLDNVELDVADNAVGGQTNTETVSINSQGQLQGVQTKLTQGHNYTVGIKAPRSLRKDIKFTAAAGATIKDFTLPLGNIAPLGHEDATINSLDYSELKSEWGSATSTAKPGDLNFDGVVNSLDWACMRIFFGQSDDSIPTAASPSPSPSPSASVSPSPAGSVSPSPSPS